MLPYLEVQTSGFSCTTSLGPRRPPWRTMPRGKTVIIGMVDSGQSIERPTSTAGPFSFDNTRVQACTLNGAKRAMNITPEMTGTVRSADNDLMSTHNPKWSLGQQG